MGPEKNTTHLQWFATLALDPGMGAAMANPATCILACRFSSAKVFLHKPNRPGQNGESCTQKHTIYPGNKYAGKKENIQEKKKKYQGKIWPPIYPGNKKHPGKEGEGIGQITKLLCSNVGVQEGTALRSFESIAARGAEQEGRNPAQGSRGFGAP